jgi:predicted acyl esterase
MNGEVELFTVVCLPSENGNFPTVIFRSPYVEDEEKKTEDELCEKKAADFAGWIERGYAVLFQHCRGQGKDRGKNVP